ncbi:methionine ABC transporter permease [Helicobacter sp. 13S00477-4]|uniref:methionine ABC transporter permease n=1 Tax=Helicobacter sp. 13S00477-4 TaxID=1905759 RepID=UPI000BA6F0CD|nr:methionine ABC transporter permease [Helicobacter sp. 13S00477-4]PAF52184.1 ABC transporter permease [Helicobacter sp. 13S00477-4]
MIFNMIYNSTFETLYMVFFSCIFAVIFGLPLGIFLQITQKDGIAPMPLVNKILGGVVNTARSFPFIILIILLLPLSRFMIGTSIGSTAAIIPLSISAIPFVARLFEAALAEVPKGLIEAAQSIGANKFIIVKMMVSESLPSLVNALTITTISLIGYSAMAGAVGAGGLGDLAIRIGYQTYRPDILFYSVITIIILVQIIQSIGDLIAKRLRKYK